ncbi:MAG: hypothetical protein KF753_01565 [Caldilineaceae bacterium]|nr:hypothetical protein [Caldilineaceae bacterium]
MSDETHYQVLGIHRRAPIEVIDAAYQRLQRVHQGEYMPVLPGVEVEETPAQARWRRIQLAYDILSSPIHRPIYDDKLWEQARRAGPPKKKPDPKNVLAPSGAWLSSQKRADGYLFFRVGWCADFGETQSALEEAIPASDRLYSPETGQWRVVDGYDDVLDELFDNFERADQPAPQEPYRPIYQRPDFTPTIRRTWQPWTGWPLVVIVGLVVAIGATLFFPANRQAEIAAQATATAVVAANAARSFVNQGPTPTLTPVPVIVKPAVLAYGSVNLRSGPGTDFPSLALLDNQREYLLIGRTIDNSWLVISDGEQTGWVAALTLTPVDNLTDLPLFQADDELPDFVPTPTPTPEAEGLE